MNILARFRLVDVLSLKNQYQWFLSTGDGSRTLKSLGISGE